MDKKQSPESGEPEDFQASTARKGAHAQGGVEPQPGDPTSPKDAARRAAERNAQIEAEGFGDHKGGRI